MSKMVSSDFKKRLEQIQSAVSTEVKANAEDTIALTEEPLPSNTDFKKLYEEESIIKVLQEVQQISEARIEYCKQFLGFIKNNPQDCKNYVLKHFEMEISKNILDPKDYVRKIFTNHIEMYEFVIAKLAEPTQDSIDAAFLAFKISDIFLWEKRHISNAQASEPQELTFIKTLFGKLKPYTSPLLKDMLSIKHQYINFDKKNRRLRAQFNEYLASSYNEVSKIFKTPHYFRPKQRDYYQNLYIELKINIENAAKDYNDLIKNLIREHDKQDKESVGVIFAVKSTLKIKRFLFSFNERVNGPARKLIESAKMIFPLSRSILCLLESGVNKNNNINKTFKDLELSLETHSMIQAKIEFETKLLEESQLAIDQESGEPDSYIRMSEIVCSKLQEANKVLDEIDLWRKDFIRSRTTEQKEKTATHPLEAAINGSKTSLSDETKTKVEELQRHESKPAQKKEENSKERSPEDKQMEETFRERNSKKTDELNRKKQEIKEDIEYNLTDARLKDANKKRRELSNCELKERQDRIASSIKLTPHIKELFQALYSEDFREKQAMKFGHRQLMNLAEMLINKGEIISIEPPKGGSSHYAIKIGSKETHGFVETTGAWNLKDDVSFPTRILNGIQLAFKRSGYTPDLLGLTLSEEKQAAKQQNKVKSKKGKKR